MPVHFKTANARLEELNLIVRALQRFEENVVVQEHYQEALPCIQLAIVEVQQAIQKVRDHGYSTGH